MTMLACTDETVGGIVVADPKRAGFSVSWWSIFFHENHHAPPPANRSAMKTRIAFMMYPSGDGYGLHRRRWQRRRTVPCMTYFAARKTRTRWTTRKTAPVNTSRQKSHGSQKRT